MDPVDPAITSTSERLGDLALSEVRLQRDARFSWVTLIPRGTNTCEIADLSPDERVLLMDDIVASTAAVRAVGEAVGRPVDKINVGQLGNMVRQLHVHVVGRRPDDALWPGPVWGAPGAQSYSEADWAAAVAAAKKAFGF